jgi:hypothetical protein
MTESYTTNDLILYLYNETGITDTVFIQHAIDHDAEVEEEFRQLVAVKDLLGYTTLVTPRPSSVDSIMAYSGMHSFL